MSPTGDRPISAARLADELGDLLPRLADVPDESFALVDRVRDLVRAVVMTDVDAGTRAIVAASIDEATRALEARTRPDPLFLVRHEDGRVESMLQAGSGRLNPQAPPIEWIVRPTEPRPGSDPSPAAVHARCTFTEAHAGSPGRVYGGVLALVLDEALGVAARAGGASGLTVSITVNLKGSTPFGRPVDIHARYAHSDGRKSYTEGEIVVDGVVSVSATALLVQERRS